MPRQTWYKADHRGFGAFMMSRQVRRPVRLICEVIAAEASATDGTSIADDYEVERGPAVTVAGNPRISMRVVNNNRLAAAYEFGTGDRAEGTSGGAERRNAQRGSSPARRHLGQVAAKHHSALGGAG